MSQYKGTIAGAAAGLIIGSFIPGLGLLTGAKYGAALGSLFDRTDQDSPTYKWTLNDNTRSEDLPLAVIYGTHKFIGNTIYEYQPGPKRMNSDYIGNPHDNDGDTIFSLSHTNVCTSPLPVITIRCAGPSYIRHDFVAGPGFLPYTVNYAAGQITFSHFVSSAYLSALLGVTIDSWGIYADYHYTPSAVKTARKCIGLCEGEIQDVSNIQINDIDIEALQNCTCNVYLGTSAQTSDPLNANSENFRNTAYLALEVTANAKINGSLKASCIIQGKKVSVWHSGSGTWVTEWSDNPAYCLLDWLTNTRYGCGVSLSKIDTSTFIDVANYCDELVDGEPRYSLNIALDSSVEAQSSIETLLRTFSGILIYSDQKIKLKVEKSEVPTFTFDMDNIVRGSFTYTPAPKRREVPNKLWIEFIDPDNPSRPWEPAKLLIEDEVDQEYREEVVEVNQQFWGVTSPKQAGRLGWLTFDYARYCRQYCSFRVGINSIQNEVGDVVNVTHTHPGWINKKFRILSIELDKTGEASLTLRAYNGNIYHDRLVQYVRQNETALPNPFAAPEVSNIILAENCYKNSDGTWQSKIDVSFDTPDYIYCSDAIVYIKEGIGDYINDGSIKIDSGVTELYVTKPVKLDTVYRVKIKLVSSLGIVSDGIESGTITLTGGIIPPDPATVALTVLSSGLLIKTV